jgi:hypothetical protein
MAKCPVCKDEGDMQPDGDDIRDARLSLRSARSAARGWTRLHDERRGDWAMSPAARRTCPSPPNKVLLVPESAAGPDAAPVLIGIPPGPAPSAATVLIGVPPAPPETPDKLLIEVPAAPPEAPPAPPESLLIGIPPAPVELTTPAAMLIGVAPPEPERVLIEVPPEPQQRLIELPTPAPSHRNPIPRSC